MQFGFNPLLCPPAILYGVFGGLMRRFIRKNPSVFRLALSYALPVIIGSILYQSMMLSYFYFDGTLLAGFAYYLGTRTFQFFHHAGGGSCHHLCSAENKNFYPYGLMESRKG